MGSADIPDYFRLLVLQMNSLLSLHVND
uniref:Uncharacterized protein n=1 Tax=Lepeophtheirus salmonis TaxID=72036 RepID=A0A0K2U044_LEPSM